jgi:Zn finger protein HypA/HybF involved in hydrogenase expression
MHASQKSWVDNASANAAVVDAQSKKTYQSIRALMSLVSGVDDYVISNESRQGVIKKFYLKELAKRYRSDQIMSLSDAISVFWETVFKYLPKAEATGTKVKVRVVDGQDSIGAVKIGTISTSERATSCNPIYYLRSMGIMGVRNTINKMYRRHLMQVCDDCQSISAISSVEDKDTMKCPECGSSDTTKHWPSKSSTYKSKKSRKCTACSHVWARTFDRMCCSCQSRNTHIEGRHTYNVDINAESDTSHAVDQMIDHETDLEFDDLVRDIRQSLPSDPNNKDTVSRTVEIYDILTNPTSGAAICTLCKVSAKTPDATCGADTFILSKCINYSKRIGAYHGCSASLSARRVKKIRSYVLRYMLSHHVDKKTIDKFMRDGLV